MVRRARAAPSDWMSLASWRRRSRSAVVLHRDREFAVGDHAAIAVAELAADRVVGRDRHESVQDVVVDVLRHLFPALRPRQQLQPVCEIAQTEMVERGAILRRRGIEGDPRARVAHLGRQFRLVGGRGDQRLHADLETIQRPPRLARPRPHGRQHHFLDVGRRAYRMRPDALGNFARHLTHHRVHGGEMNGNVGMLDRTRIEQGHHQIDVVMRSSYVERRAVLPAIPDHADGPHVLAHPRPGGRPGHAETSLDMGLHLRTQTEREAATGQLLQRPRAHRGHGRAARKGDRDRCAELQGPRRLGRQRQQDERIVLGFLDHQSVVADLFQQSCVGRDGMKIERDFGRAQAWVDLAQRQKRFKQHVVTLR